MRVFEHEDRVVQMKHGRKANGLFGLVYLLKLF
jgi:hypothetical protein